MGIFSKKKKDDGLKELVGVCECGADFNPEDRQECSDCSKLICPACGYGAQKRFCHDCYQEIVWRQEREREQIRRRKRAGEEKERERQRISKEEWSTVGTYYGGQHGWRIGIAKVHEKRKDGK